MDDKGSNRKAKIEFARRRFLSRATLGAAAFVLTADVGGAGANNDVLGVGRSGGNDQWVKQVKIALAEPGMDASADRPAYLLRRSYLMAQKKDKSDSAEPPWSGNQP